jgi:hypothetical protein
MAVADGPERRAGDAVWASLRRPAVPHAGPVPAVLAHHVRRRVHAHLRAVVLHGAAPPLAAPGPGGVPRGGGVRGRADPGPLRLLLPAVPDPVPPDAVRGGAARGLRRGAVRAPRRAGAPAGERARAGACRHCHRHLRHVLGLLPHAARLRHAVREVRRDVAGVLRRRVRVRPAHRQARRAVRRHDLVRVISVPLLAFSVVWSCEMVTREECPQLGVLGVRDLGPHRRLAAKLHREHVAGCNVVSHLGTAGSFAYHTGS